MEFDEKFRRIAADDDDSIEPEVVLGVNYIKRYNNSFYQINITGQASCYR